MPAVLSFVELDAQHVELLPARTVLSTVSPQIPIGDASDNGNGDGLFSGDMSVLGMSAGDHGTHGSNGASR
jgi:hypothetical protein